MDSYHENVDYELKYLKKDLRYIDEDIRYMDDPDNINSVFQGAVEYDVVLETADRPHPDIANLGIAKPAKRPHLGHASQEHRKRFRPHQGTARPSQRAGPVPGP